MGKKIWKREELMSVKLSIFLAGIRKNNWLNLYQSIPNVTTLTDYELVIVSPYDLPSELQNIDNVHLIKDSGCPSRCYQLGLLHSKGEYVLYAVDDGLFSPTMAIDKAFDIMPENRGAVSFTFTESRSLEHIEPNKMSWVLGNHAFYRKLKSVPNHYLLIMNALIRRDHLIEIGGFDCRFENPGIGAVDLAIRLQNDGAEVVMGDKFMDLVNEVGNQHQPIEDAHVCDMALFKSIYNNAPNRGKIDVNNWKASEKVWSRRSL